MILDWETVPSKDLQLGLPSQSKTSLLIRKPVSTHSIKGGNDFDDLLDELLDKEVKRNSRKKIDNNSHTFTEKNFTPTKQLNQTEHWEPLDIMMGSKNELPDLGKTY